MIDPNFASFQALHQDEDFDYDIFFDTISFSPPLIEEKGLRFSAMFLFRDEKGKVYGQYRFREEDQGNDYAEFLRAYRHYLDDPAHADSSITKVFRRFYFQDFEGEDPLEIDEEKGPLMYEDLNEYFEKPAEKKQSQFKQYEEKLVRDTLQPEVKTPPFEKNYSYFIPLPIICCGHLVGMVYFIYDVRFIQLNDKNLKDIMRILIPQMTREYERILLETKYREYAPKPENPIEDYAAVFTNLDEPGPTGIIRGNPFLISLGYDKYYKNLRKVITKEALFIVESKKDTIKSAIISIIVDSYAHNIGAHTLSALKWWFENRFKIMDAKFPLKVEKEDGTGKRFIELETHLQVGRSDLIKIAKRDEFYSDISWSESAHANSEVSLMDLLRFLPKKLQDQLFTFFDQGANPPALMGRMPLPIDFALYRFFESLRSKSAFWGGVTRDVITGGRLRTWFFLVREFLSNPFFLGTITHSEGVNRVNLFIEVIEKDEQGRDLVNIGGRFAEVNLELIRKERIAEFEPPAEQGAKTYSDYAFIRPGEEYKSIKKKLLELPPAYFPNGIIGEQAFYTMLENTMRNIKHYKARMAQIQQSGVNLYLSIQQVGFIEREGNGEPTKEQKLYKVGIWLHHEQDLIENRSNKIITVIDRHTTQLKERIINKTGKARLGGNSQDRVCASMLMNNSFYSIDEFDPKNAKKHYFPYVIPASEYWENGVIKRANKHIVKDSVLHIAYNHKIRAAASTERHQNYEREAKAMLADILTDPENPKTGIIKKYFHLWVGQDVKITEGDLEIQNENLARFRILVIPKLDAESLKNMRRIGIVRLIEQDRRLKDLTFDTERYQYAITQWLGHWLPLHGEYDKNYFSLNIQKPQKGGPGFRTIGRINLFRKRSEQPWELSYENMHQLDENIKSQYPALRIGHGIEGTTAEVREVCNIRTHGSFMTYLFPGLDFNRLHLAEFTSPRIKPPIPTIRPAKLLETVATQIHIFDNRMYERLPERSTGYDPFRGQLGLFTYREDKQVFDDYRNNYLGKTHVLIFHLSFLETFFKRDIFEPQTLQVEDSGKEVLIFFEEKIQAWYSTLYRVDLPSNFLFVITSGRGRDDWVESIKHPNITFRPIEALMNAVEDALTLKDDYQAKHNLCNVLFGS